MLSPKEVLITDYVHEALLQGLDSLGLSYTYAPEMKRNEMEDVLPRYKGVVINTRCAIDRRCLEQCKSLRWIARLGSGLDIIDLDAAAEKNIEVISAPEGNAVAVAEHAMAMLLCLSNKIIPAHSAVIAGKWPREENRGWEIEGKTIGIIGFGNNGSAFARLWKGWNVKMLAYDKYLENYGDDHVRALDQDTLLRESDIISIHIPLTAETKNLVDDRFISKCKDGFVLINTSRGRIVDLSALLRALQAGKIKGACLDVLPYEPPATGPDDYRKMIENLSGMKNVVLTPHIAGWTVESKRKIAKVLLSKIEKISRGEKT